MRGIGCVAVVLAAGAAWIGPAWAAHRHHGVEIVRGGEHGDRRSDRHDGRDHRHPGARVIGIGRGFGRGVGFGPGVVGGVAGGPVPFDGGPPDGSLDPNAGPDLAGAPPDTYEEVRPRYYQEPTYEHSAPPVIYRVPTRQAVSPLPPVVYCGGYDDDCPGRRRVRVYGGY